MALKYFRVQGRFLQPQLPRPTGPSYDIWLFPTSEERDSKDFSKAAKIGSAGSLNEFNALTGGQRGYIGCSMPGTQEWVSYEYVMSTWGQEPGTFQSKTE